MMSKAKNKKLVAPRTNESVSVAKAKVNEVGRQPAKQSARERMQFHLSGCALDYARAIGNPMTGPLACIPSFPSLRTRRFRVFSRGTFNTNTAGFGFVVVNPISMLANDVNAVYYSSSGSAFTSPQTIDLAAVSNSEYTTASFGTAPGLAQGRVVSCCVRIRYIGNELSRGGQILGFSDPDHSTLIGRGFVAIDGEEDSRKFEVDRKWKTCYYSPAFDDELAFQGNVTTPFTAQYSNFMGFCVQSTATGVSLPYEFEVWTVAEINGRNVTGRTPSLADPNGFAAVTSVMTMSKIVPSAAPIEDNEKAMVLQTNQYAERHLTSTKPKPPPTKESHGIDWMGILNTGIQLLPELLALF